MFRVTVKSTDLRERTKRSDGSIFAYEQTGYIWIPDAKGKAPDFPEKITLTHWVRNGKPERDAYPPGDYVITGDSFTVGDYGVLQCSPRLVPVAAQSAARAA